MRRFTSTVIGLLLLLPLNATSLGLSDIELRSALNQPLDAEIGLTSLGQTPIDEIRVGLASREAFTQAGLPRPLFLSGLRFEIADSANGPVIKVTSSDPVVEPFLDFLIEVNWPNGRLLREYTVLIDPPLFLDESPAPVAAPTAVAEAPVVENPAQSAPPASASTPRRVAGTRGAAESGARPGANGAWEYGPVARDATLWSIAEEMRALDESWSIEQIMMALLRDNPEAFYNGNVNELKAGYVLRIDDPATIGDMSRAEAIAEARRQAEQWMDTKRTVAERAGARPQGGETAAAASPGGAGMADTGPRLRLSAPDALDAGRMSAGAAETGEEGATVARLREDLAAALEVSEAARQENADLRQRLVELEEQIASMQRLISLQEDTLAAMQAGAGAAAGAGSPEQRPTEGRTERQATPAAPPVGQVEDGMTTPIDQVFAMLDDPLMLGFAGLVVLGIATLGWLVVRRRRLARESLEEFTATPLVATGAAAAAAGAGKSVAATTGGDDGLDGDDFEAATASAATPVATASAPDLMQAEEDEIDILAEADVYLAYRRFDKAEELLRAAIQDDPQRHDLTLKLLEVLAAAGSAERFVAEAANAQAALQSGAAGLWDKVVVMGRRVAPDDALFAGDATPASEPVATAEAFDAAPDASDEFAVGDLGSLGDFDLGEFEGLELDDAGTGAGHSPAEGEETEVRAGEPAAFAGNEEDAAGFGPDHDDEPGVPDIGAAAGSAEDAGANDLSFDAGMEADDAAEGTHTADVLHLDPVAGAHHPAGDFAAADDAPGPRQETPQEIDWLSAVGDDLTAFEGDEGAFEGDGDEDFSGLISGTDEVGTKLDLAKAYIDMGDQESARSILSEVTEEGSEDQQREASELMRQIG